MKGLFDNHKPYLTIGFIIDLVAGDRALYQRPFNYLWDPFIDHADPNLPTKSSSGMTKFRYVPWLTEVDAGFWIALSNLKINIDQLEEPTRKLIAMYDLRPIAKPANSCNMMIKPGSFSSTGYVVLKDIT